MMSAKDENIQWNVGSLSLWILFYLFLYMNFSETHKKYLWEVKTVNQKGFPSIITHSRTTAMNSDVITLSLLTKPGVDYKCWTYSAKFEHNIQENLDVPFENPYSHVTNVTRAHLLNTIDLWLILTLCGANYAMKDWLDMNLTCV